MEKFINKGFLKLNEKNKRLEYGVFWHGTYTNLSELLNSLLLDKVRITIKDKNRILFKHKGVLFLMKDKQTGLYGYRLGKENLEDFLWNHVDDYLEIEVKS